MTNSPIYAKGASLIEVLVAVLVLSVGLLGLALTQGISLRNNTNAFLRTQATNVAYRIFDDIRANRSMMIRNGGIQAADTARYQQWATDGLPDATLTIQRVGGGAVTCNIDGCGRVEVQIEWLDTAQQGSAAQEAAMGVVDDHLIFATATQI